MLKVLVPSNGTLLLLVNTIENHGLEDDNATEARQRRQWFKFGHLTIPPADKESMSV